MLLDRTCAVSSRRRRGALHSMELLFLLPVLLLIVLALVEFSTLVAAETRLSSASREGARVAALGGTLTDVKATVTTVLGTTLGNNVNLTVAVTYPNNTSNTGDPVTVVVSAPATLLVPNYLAIIGVDLSSIILGGQTTMIIE